MTLRRPRCAINVVGLASIKETLPVPLPDVSYARSGEVSVAYQVVGNGPTDIVFVRGITGDLLSTWEQPLLVRHVEGLAACGRVLMLDKRGTGLSDRVREVQSLETTMDDVRAVMDAAGSERAVLWLGATSTGIGVLFAATYPERCAGLVLFDPTVKGTRSDDYPWAPTEEEWRARLADVRAGWGERGYLERLAREWAPEVAGDDAFRDWFVWHMRRSLSPGAALTAFRAAMELDIRDILGAVRVPTLVLPRPAVPGPGHYTASRIRGAEVVELPGLRGLYYLGGRRRAPRDDGRDGELRLAPDRTRRSRARARHRPLHRHRRLDGARLAARRLRLARPPPASSCDRPPRARRFPRP
jgi:pimeloyl-ACP methyl ester carboxylesterase